MLPNFALCFLSLSLPLALPRACCQLTAFRHTQADYYGSEPFMFVRFFCLFVGALREDGRPTVAFRIANRFPGAFTP